MTEDAETGRERDEEAADREGRSADAASDPRDEAAGDAAGTSGTDDEHTQPDEDPHRDENPRHDDAPEDGAAPEGEEPADGDRTADDRTADDRQTGTEDEEPTAETASQRTLDVADAPTAPHSSGGGRSDGDAGEPSEGGGSSSDEDGDLDDSSEREPPSEDESDVPGERGDVSDAREDDPADGGVGTTEGGSSSIAEDPGGDDSSGDEDGTGDEPEDDHDDSSTGPMPGVPDPAPSDGRDVPPDVQKYARFKKIDGAQYERVNEFLRDRTYITAREWAMARLCADFRTETGVEMTKIGENLPELVPFMTDTYSPQAVNQARHAFEEKVRKAGATFLYGAMCDFFTAEDLDDVMYEATEVAKFLLEVEGIDLTVDEELDAEERISSVMRDVREASKDMRAREGE